MTLNTTLNMALDTTLYTTLLLYSKSLDDESEYVATDTLPFSLLHGF